MICRGLPFEDEDDAYDYFRQCEIDEAADKRRASGISAELLSIQDAYHEGLRAGANGIGIAAALNPYRDPHMDEYKAWERGRNAAEAHRTNRRAT